MYYIRRLRLREVVSISLDEETLAAFDTLVRSRGSKRSLELRRLIQAELAGHGIVLAPRTKDKGSRRFNVSLTPAEYQAVAVVAQSWAMKPSQWTATLVRRWLLVDPRPSRAEMGELAAILQQIRRIGLNINQIAHAGNQLALHPSPQPHDYDILLARLPAMMDEIRGHVELLRAHRFREALYWLTPERLKEVIAGSPKPDAAQTVETSDHV